MANDPTTPVTDQGTVGDYWIDLKPNESPVRIWDKLILGSVVFPGIAGVRVEVLTETEVAKWLKTLASGSTPAQYLITLTDKGYVPARISAAVQIWTQDQWEDLKETLPQFAPRTGEKYLTSDASLLSLSVTAEAQQSKKAKGRDAFDIVHPATALLGIDAVIVTRVAVNPIVDQTLVVEMEMMQYFPNTSRRVLHSTGGSLNGGGLTPATPNAGNNLTP